MRKLAAVSLVTDEMIDRALDAAGRRGGDLGPVRMRAALEAVFAAWTPLAAQTWPG